MLAGLKTLLMFLDAERRRAWVCAWLRCERGRLRSAGSVWSLCKVARTLDCR